MESTAHSAATRAAERVLYCTVGTSCTIFTVHAQYLPVVLRTVHVLYKYMLRPVGSIEDLSRQTTRLGTANLLRT
jgi:hypothetical protein